MAEAILSGLTGSFGATKALSDVSRIIPSAGDIAMPEDHIARQVAQGAEVLQIPPKLDNKATLSGRKMQRVSTGRALVRQPRIYLMDEPHSSLDAKLRARLRIKLKRIHSRLKATFLNVMQDKPDAMITATHVRVFDQGRPV